ncbi:hypothetical protein SHL15_8280 [Streptomyces hygroscopicus subsp. limoneus]|nr:hypothetical protein SHL15_8280 [Streptomyces hygroscopicus subsp. limoneus]
MPGVLRPRPTRSAACWMPTGRGRWGGPVAGAADAEPGGGRHVRPQLLRAPARDAVPHVLVGRGARGRTGLRAHRLPGTVEQHVHPAEPPPGQAAVDQVVEGVECRALGGHRVVQRRLLTAGADALSGRRPHGGPADGAEHHPRRGARRPQTRDDSPGRTQQSRALRTPWRPSGRRAAPSRRCSWASLGWRCSWAASAWRTPCTSRCWNAARRSACGARSARTGQIRSQFLTESVVLSLLGGVTGTVIGALATAGLRRLRELAARHPAHGARRGCGRCRGHRDAGGRVPVDPCRAAHTHRGNRRGMTRRGVRPGRG